VLSQEFKAPPFLQLVIAFLLIAVYFTAQECAAHLFLGMAAANCVRVLVHQSLKGLLWAVITQCIFQFPRFFPIPLSPRTVIGVFAPTAIVVACLSTGADYALSVLLRDQPDGLGLDHIAYTRFHRALLDAVIVFGVVYALRAHELATWRATRTATLESQLAQAQMRMLQSQLQPHFLFNTLHSITTLLHRAPDRADRMITLLSDLLRMSFASAERHEVPISEELEFARRYVEIQEIRFSDRLSVEWIVQLQHQDVLVPPFLLQPLIENSVKHGISHSDDGGAIRVEISEDHASVLIRVSDTAGQPVSHPEVPSDGVGISNMRARMSTLYGPEASIQLEKNSLGGMIVTVVIPLVRVPTRKSALRVR